MLPNLLELTREQTCDEGTTVKSVWRLFDGALVESVLMRYPGRVTMCVSSQAGCGMNCPFCATGQAGLTRNLSTGEIVEQVIAGARALKRGKVAGGVGRVSNVVFMGMGEPLANYKSVVGCGPPHGRSLAGGNGPFSPKRHDESRWDSLPAMQRLRREGLNVTFALSLHAPDDELARHLVPVNTRWPVAEVLQAAWEYTETDEPTSVD